MYTYDYDFEKNNEIIIGNFHDIPIDINGKRSLVNVVLTNRNLLFFYDTTKDSPLRAPMIYEIANHELICKVSINKAKFNNKPTESDTQIIINEKSIIIYNLDLIPLINL